MSVPVLNSPALAGSRHARRSLWQTLSALKRLTRFDRAVLAAAYVMLGGYLAGAPIFADAVVRAAFVILCIVCFANVVNDHADIAVDSVTRPDRPIPSGECSANFALVLAVAFAFTALAAAATVSVTVTAIAAAMIALSGAYSWWLKGTLLLGNVVIAVLVGATVVCGALAWQNVTDAVMIASAIIAVYVLGQEVLFNLEDEAGDRASGVHTTAARLRTSNTLALYRALLVVSLCVALVPALQRVASVAYLSATIVCVAIPIVIQLVLLKAPLNAAKLARAARISRLLWFTGAVPLLLLLKW